MEYFINTNIHTRTGLHARTYQYRMHTNILKDGSEQRASGQTVPGMLRAYKFVNMQTQMLHMYIQTHTHARRMFIVQPSAVAAPYQCAAGRLSVLNELDHTK